MRVYLAVRTSFEFLVDCVVHTSAKEPFLLIVNSFYLRQKEE